MENIRNELENVINEVDELKNLLKILKLKIVATHKHSSKKINSLEKKLQKKNQKRKNPSGFAKPSKITSELCFFMNKPPGTKIARTEVTRYLIHYIKHLILLLNPPIFVDIIMMIIIIIIYLNNYEFKLVLL